MRPEDLKPPFPKDDRRIVIHDRVWYVPAPHFTQNDYIFPGWEHPDFFGNANPTCIEYCSGNGTWIAEQALANPHQNWVAIEKKFMRVRKIWSKIKNLNLNNLIVVCGEAFLTTNRYFADSSVADVYINFPDPWPKKKHAKNRLFQPTFVKEMTRIMAPQKTLTFVTDDHPFSDEVIGVFAEEENFRSLYPELSYTTEDQAYGTSFFDELWRSKGKVIRYHRYLRK
jgi:tRNA (guanine-N7-)-methyltransferase